MASLQLEKPIKESFPPVANCEHDEHTTAQKHQEADAKQVATVKSEKHLTKFYSHESESLQHGKQTTAVRKTKEKGKKEASKELYAEKYDSTNMVALKPMKALKNKEEEKKKKSKSKSKDDSSGSSESHKDDVCSKKKGGKGKKHK